MNHSFDIEVAKRYGVDAAIVIENFRFWIAKNKANGRHFYDGRWWTYNSVKAFSELFPYWSAPQIRRVLDRLEDHGVLTSGSYNQSPWDRTKWYCLADELHSPNLSAPFDEIGKSHTDISTDGKPDAAHRPPRGGRKRTANAAISQALADGVEQSHLDDWIKARKSPLTMTAWEGVKTEAQKAGISPAEAVRICAVKGWRGFDSTWNWRSASHSGQPSNSDQRDAEAMKLLGFGQGDFIDA